MRPAAITRWLLTARRHAIPLAAVVVALSMIPPAAAQSQPTLSQPRPAQGDVQSLVREVEMQLHLVYRNNLPEYARRSEQLRSAVDAWQHSAQTAADHDTITGWLRQSIHNSMPSSHAALPPVPEFAPAAQVAQPNMTQPRANGRQMAGPMRRSVLRAPQAALPPAPTPPRGAPAVRQQTAKPIPGQPTPGQPTPGKPTLAKPTLGQRTRGKPTIGDAKIETVEGPSLWDRHPAAELSLPELSAGDPFLDDPGQSDFDLSEPTE